MPGFNSKVTSAVSPKTCRAKSYAGKIVVTIWSLPSVGFSDGSEQPQSITADSNSKRNRLSIIYPLCTLTAQAVDNSLADIDNKIVAALDMALHIRHKAAVHVNKPSAFFALEVEMLLTLLRFVELITGRVAVRKPLQHALRGEFGECSVNGCLARGYLAAPDYLFRSEAFSAVLIEKLDYLIALLGFVDIFAHFALPFSISSAALIETHSAYRFFRMKSL